MAAQPASLKAQRDKVMQRWWMNVQWIQQSAAGCCDSEGVMQAEKLREAGLFA